MLKMKKACERCQESLPAKAEAWICSFECSWCPECARGLDYRCPNCAGELQQRPRRQRSVPDVAFARVTHCLKNVFPGNRRPR